VYYFGDFDQAGYDAANSLEEKLERFAGEDGNFNVIFNHVAITQEQIIELSLSTREHKRGRERDRQWPHPYACELDAIAPDTLRSMVRSCIEQHLPRDKLERLKIIENAERETFMEMARGMGHKPEMDRDVFEDVFNTLFGDPDKRPPTPDEE
jgi:hypothetical protein